MIPKRVGWTVAVVVLAIDQALKVAVMSPLRPQEPVSLLPFLSLSLQYNTGVSFSLFAQTTQFGRLMLLVVAVLAIAMLSYWLSRCKSFWAAAGLGSIIGGAAGNVMDRLSRGAVVDYLDLHFFDRHLFVFNFADAAINVGVALLALDLLFAPRPQAESAPQ